MAILPQGITIGTYSMNLLELVITVDYFLAFFKREMEILVGACVR
jgi:hypothetical protein